MKPKPGSYNIRVEVDKNGKMSLGYVMKCYKAKPQPAPGQCGKKNPRMIPCSEWKEVPKSILEGFLKILNKP